MRSLSGVVMAVFRNQAALSLVGHNSLTGQCMHTDFECGGVGKGRVEVTCVVEDVVQLQKIWDNKSQRKNA